MKKPRICLFDLETSYNMVLAFDNFQTNINHENIVVERYIHCVSYKWYGEKTIHTISQLDDPKRFKNNIHDDYYVAKTFRDIIETADACVAHYGDGFDVPMLNGRLLLNGLPPLPKIISHDTKKMASKYFRLNFNKLEYIAKALGYKGKTENPKNLWRACFFGDVQALKHLARYNRNDIDLLNFVYEKVMPFIKNQSLNANLFFEGLRCTNPICGSLNLQQRGWRLTATGRNKRFSCNDCGQWSNERKAFLKEKPIMI